MKKKLARDRRRLPETKKAGNCCGCVGSTYLKENGKNWHSTSSQREEEKRKEEQRIRRKRKAESK